MAKTLKEIINSDKNTTAVIGLTSIPIFMNSYQHISYYFRHIKEANYYRYMADRFNEFPSDSKMVYLLDNLKENAKELANNHLTMGIWLASAGAMMIYSAAVFYQKTKKASISENPIDAKVTSK